MTREGFMLLASFLVLPTSPPLAILVQISLLALESRFFNADAKLAFRGQAR